jgi:hypothetical protein
VKAAEPSQRDQVRKNMDSLAKSTRKQKKQLAQQAEQGGDDAAQSQLENPFGGLGGTPAAPPPTP